MNAVRHAHVTGCSKPVKAIVAVAVAAAVCAACGKNPGDPNVAPRVEPNGGPQITRSADSVVVSEGDGSLLIAPIRDATGPAQYVSRVQSVATVTANVLIRAVATGSTYVVATLSDRPNVPDSVRVRVHALPTDGDPRDRLHRHVGIDPRAGS
jgi:hypothetical protein